jgi:soluble lytic murein transglycosylase
MLGAIAAPFQTMSKPSEHRYAQVYLGLRLALARAARTAATAGLLLAAGACAAQPAAPLQPSDQVFLALRDAARNNDAPTAAMLGAQLGGYAPQSYVDYFMLKPQLFDSGSHALADAPDAPVQAFLQRYDGLAIADRLRNDYLLVLGARHDWNNFDAQYSRFVLNDDTQVKCYALESRAAHGENVAAAARTLLVDPKGYGDGCVDLINALAQQNQFGSDDVWQQIRIAYEQNYVNTGNRIADALGAERPDPSVFDKVASAPPLYLARGIGSGKWFQELGVLALVRMARNDPAAAAASFDRVGPALSGKRRAEAWGSIAYLAALRRMPEALDWYRNAKDATLSNPAYEWRVRTALLAGDWKMVRTSIEAMPAPLRNQPSWVYWHARALREEGKEGEAQQEFAQIAPQFNFYGQLASEELGQKITTPPKTVVADADVAAVAGLPGFQLAQRFYAMNLRFEGNREWNWTLRNMSDRQLLASAEYARRIELYDRTVNTADRTVSEHDFSLRYVSPFRDIVQRDAVTTGLDIEWAYGLIRQESRFIINAQSGVGATGLMQLMPGTAKLVAKKIGLGALSPAQMADLDTNILLGTNYLESIYSQLDNSPVLASAGYNAGPGRARMWRDTLTHPVEGAIYAETIPFNETRDYVKNVLSNTTYYAALFEGRPQSLKARLGIITP